MEPWEKDLQQRFVLEDSFNDTQNKCQTNPRLKESVEKSVSTQNIITNPASDKDALTVSPEKKKNGHIKVTRHKSFEEAAGWARQGKKVAVLNFASALMPGGGGHKVRLTQETCLCRESTLYQCISDQSCIDGFYTPHRVLNQLYNDDMIYTPDVTVFKTPDEVPQDMPEEDWFKVDVITMAAPNITGFIPRANDSLFNEFGFEKAVGKIFKKRFALIMREAYEHDVDVLVLGAFGCGEFGNDPKIVAMAAAEAIDEYGFKEAFDMIEFDIYEKDSKKLFHMFRMVMDKYYCM